MNLEIRLGKIMGFELFNKYYDIYNNNEQDGYITDAGAKTILEYAKKENLTKAQRNALLILLFKHCRESKKYFKKKNK